MTRKLYWPMFASIVVAALTAGVALGRESEHSDIEISIHDGDLKAGSGIPGSATPTTCSDALYAQALGFLNSLRKPAIVTPGDNDSTDCDRPANGGFNSLERLDHEREVFFSTPFSLGRHQLRLQVQSTPNCLGVTGPTPCVENRRWTFKDVTYATLNVQGSCNNLCDTLPDPAEYAARNAANIAWVQQSFAEARFKRSSAAVRTEAIAFRRPVVYVHGDSHYFRIDKPLLDAQGRRLENFTHLETFGDNQANGNNDVNWVKVLVDPSSRDVFAFQPQIVPANRTAVPAPWTPRGSTG